MGALFLLNELRCCDWLRLFRCCDLLLRNVQGHLLHCFRLVLLRRMSVTHHHVDFGMAEHGSQRHKVNSRHGCSGGPGMAEVIKAERRNLAVPHGSVVRIINLWDGSGVVCVAREHVMLGGL